MLVLLKEISFIDRFLYQRRGRFDVLQMERKKGVFTWGCTGKNSMIRTWCEHNSLLKSKISVISTVRCHHVCKTPEPWHFSPEDAIYKATAMLSKILATFGGFEFSSLDSESETASGANTRPSPRPSLYNSWITRPIPSPRRVLGRESRYFESETPFFTIKRYYFYPNFDENTA